MEKILNLHNNKNYNKTEIVYNRNDPFNVKQ